MATKEPENEVIASSIAKELITISDCLRWATSRFNEANLFYGHGTESAWDEAVHLVLQLIHLPLDIDDRVLDARLTHSEREIIVKCIYRRVVERIPLPYLTNVAWFAGMKFYVDQRVIIPKSPIGELVRNGFSPWVEHDHIASVLDLCTGSGCIGIGAAHAFPNADVTISDISPDALEVAKRNVRDHKLSSKITLVESDLFKNLDGAHFDLIISNPPYVDKGDIDTMPEEYHKEPRLALEAGEDGLELVRRILRQAPHHLNANGVLIVEVGNSQYSLQNTFPNVPFTWLNFEDGGDGVFVLTSEELLKYHEEFLKVEV